MPFLPNHTSCKLVFISYNLNIFVNSMKKTIIICLVFLFIITDSYGYNNKRVILLVNKEAQKDSFSYNVVDEILELVYNSMKADKLVMWDSPRKLNKIDYNTLQSIEITSSLPFLGCSNFFIYEKWSSGGGSTSFDIFGFVFSSVNDKNEEVNFGYVDYFDISDILKATFLKANVNTNYKTSLYHVLMNKTYNFDLLSFNDAAIVKSNSKNPIKDYQKGRKIIDKAFYGKNKNKNYIQIQDSKLLYYTIKSTDYNPESEKFISIIEEYFDLHRRELMEYGGEWILKSFREIPFMISECRVSEIWINQNGEIRYELLNIQPYVFGKAFNQKIPYKTIRSLNIENDDEESLLDLINSRKLKFHLLEINNVEISEDDADLYIEGLLKTNWNKLEEYIESP